MTTFPKTKGIMSHTDNTETVNPYANEYRSGYRVRVKKTARNTQRSARRKTKMSLLIARFYPEHDIVRGRERHLLNDAIGTI